MPSRRSPLPVATGPFGGPNFEKETRRFAFDAATAEAEIALLRGIRVLAPQKCE
jgi:hypothetical protein